MSGHLEVVGGERLVVIDGERFPCIDVTLDPTPDGAYGGTFYHIPLENRLVASYCNGPTEWGGHAEVWLQWISPWKAEGNFLSALIDNGVVILQSPQSAAAHIEEVESGTELRALLVAWSQLPIIDSAALSAYRLDYPCSSS